MKRFAYETHAHTAETSPCATVPAQDLVQIYSRLGYTGLVVTDHYYADLFPRDKGWGWQELMDHWLTGYRSARSEGSRLGLQVILGMEIRLDGSGNDYLVYGISEDFLRSQEALYRLDLPELKALAKAHGFLVYQAHPFRAGATVAPTAYLDGIEVYNGNIRHDSRNALASAHAVGHGLMMSSGSDFHHADDRASGGMWFPEAPGTGRELVECMVNASGDSLISLGA